MKTIIKDAKNLIAKYKPEDIETALVVYYIQKNNIKINKNDDIKFIIGRQNKKTKEIIETFSSIEKNINIYVLINYFEILVPQDDKKINGAFFTPKNIASFMTQEIFKNNRLERNSKICDPSCGCGAFLIESAIEINKKFGEKFIKIIENNLYGADIAEYSIKRAKILLTLLALSNNEDEKNINFNLIITDSLLNNLPKLFSNKKEVISGFDFVIGNPPYVKFQDLNKKTRIDLFNNWETLKNGSYNLYFAFFELGINILKNDGLLCYITPNNYFTSLSGVKLREYLTNNTYINKIIDFNHLKLFEAQTYTCITFLDKNKKESFYYAKIDNYDYLEDLNNIKFSTTFYNNLNNRKWRLLRDEDQKNIQKIESLTKLKDMVDIRVGIATCKDDVYFIDGNNLNNNYYTKTYNGIDYLIEKTITKSILKISDFKNQKELDNNKRKIIFPYQKVNGKIEIIRSEEMKNKFPKCYKYLLSVKDVLDTRDKGAVKYIEWYAYARSQGLNFYGEKLTTPTFSGKPRFLEEKDADTLFCNGYAIYLKSKSTLFQKNQLSLRVLSKILNSIVMDYYISKTSVSIEGGFPCYQKNFIELFGIPEMTKKEVDYLEMETKKEKIDNFLLKKYDIIL